MAQRSGTSNVPYRPIPFRLSLPRQTINVIIASPIISVQLSLILRTSHSLEIPRGRRLSLLPNIASLFDGNLALVSCARSC